MDKKVFEQAAESLDSAIVAAREKVEKEAGPAALELFQALVCASSHSTLIMNLVLAGAPQEVKDGMSAALSHMIVDFAGHLAVAAKLTSEAVQLVDAQYNDITAVVLATENVMNGSVTDTKFH